MVATFFVARGRLGDAAGKSWDDAIRRAGRLSAIIGKHTTQSHGVISRGLRNTESAKAGDYYIFFHSCASNLPKP